MTAFRLLSAGLLSIALSSPVAAQPAVQTIYVWSFNFAPKPIHLRAGVPVTLNFVNRSGGGHDFTAKGFFARSRFLRVPIIAVKCDRLFSLSGGYLHAWN